MQEREPFLLQPIAGMAQAVPGVTLLDSDIAMVDSQIAGALAEAKRYTGGALLTEIQLRLAILQNTKAMSPSRESQRKSLI
jgi:hypothetical protein